MKILKLHRLNIKLIVSRKRIVIKILKQEMEDLC